MSIKLGVADTTVSHLKPRIAVIGVGGGGGNAVNNMIAKNLEGVDFVVANTDAQALAHSSASRKIQLGLEITQGLGAGARPEIGKIAAEEAKEEIARELEGVNMVFITAGMGGGTGSGAAPVVAHIAKEKGILTVGVVTKPFSFEGRKRMETAESALANFTSEVDSIIVIPNQNLFRIADKKTTLAEAFLMADDVLYSGVRSITDLMMMPGLINLDFADVKNIMQDKGKAIMGTGEAEGDNRAEEAAKQALSNPLLDDCTMHGAKGVLINITGGDDITLMEIDEAANIIKEEVDDNANIIFGSSYDEALAGKIRVSIVVTGISDGKPQPEALPRTKEPSLIDQSYDDSNFVPTVVPAENLIVEDVAPVSLDLPEDSEPAASLETAEENTQPAAEDNALADDFASLDKSDELPEVPQASALFNAIMNSSANKTEDEEAGTEELNVAATSKDSDFFFSSTSLQNISEKEDEPVLFKEHDSDIFKDSKPAEPANEPEDDSHADEDDVKPTFIERVIGYRNRKKKEEVEELPENIVKFSAEDNNDVPELSSDELDIPSFLRRK
ncbi:MAG: cell division protein FtsZ [Alphaproteobacteria bacterium]|nr:cell division protein FtsZ [Alphaproteobacteria bacterium]MDY4690262.1 cell division protein FtsZ [Alphaproteobacteria bacterium]